MRFDKEHSQDEQTTRLIEAALEARNNAHCPYSKFRVGAALLTAEGKVFRGCNIESCSFSPTICAERVAIASAVVAGYTKFTTIAISSDLNDTPITPCGVCRQAMREFGKDLTILLVCPDKRFCRSSLEELLPASFGPDSLEKAL